MSELLEVSEEVRAGARIVTIRGELDLGGADQVRGPLESAAADTSRPLVIELSDCTFIDSTGLATILHVTRPMRDGGASVTFACPDGEVRRLFEVSALDLTFPIVDSLDEALA